MMSPPTRPEFSSYLPLVALRHNRPLLRLALEAKRLKNNFPEFVRAAWPQIEGNRALAWNWHLDLISSALADVESGAHRRVILNVPPRATKSTLVSVMFPLWVWARDPSRQFMFASYSWGLAQDHAYKRRALLESDWYGEHYGYLVQPRGDRANIMNIATTAGGLIYSTSSRGSVLGRGSDYLVLDDPNDTKEPESQVQRRTLHNWYDVVWSTRANDQATVREIVIQQRTHLEDITGHALKIGTWRHIKIPMEFEPSSRVAGDPRQTKGELLDPVRFPREEVEALKRRLGPYAAAGQLQQEPFPLGGGMIRADWFRKWRASERQPEHLQTEDGQYHFDPRRTLRFAVVDPAVTGKEVGEKKISDPDYTVIAACAALSTPRGPYLFLLDLVRERMEGPDIIPRLQAMHRRWKFSIIGIESTAFQLMLFQQAKRLDLPVREISTRADESAIYRIDKDKTGRVLAATPMLADGRVFLPEYAPWLSDFLAEVTAFPNAAHDDQADVLAYSIAIAEKYKGEPIYRPEEEERPPRPTADPDTPRDVLANYYGARPPGI